MGVGKTSSALVLITSVLHWKWHIDAFKWMCMPSTFHFFYLCSFFTLRLFHFHRGFFVVSVRTGDRCTVGSLKLCNVYIIHITPQKVLIKLYMANGVGSHRLKVLLISQMSLWIDRVLQRVWFENSLDLTPGIFAWCFYLLPLFSCLSFQGSMTCVLE